MLSVQSLAAGHLGGQRQPVPNAEIFNILIQQDIIYLKLMSWPKSLKKLSHHVPPGWPEFLSSWMVPDFFHQTVVGGPVPQTFGFHHASMTMFVSRSSRSKYTCPVHGGQPVQTQHDIAPLAEWTKARLLCDVEGTQVPPQG